MLHKKLYRAQCLRVNDCYTLLRIERFECTEFWSINHAVLEIFDRDENEKGDRSEIDQPDLSLGVSEKNKCDQLGEGTDIENDGKENSLAGQSVAIAR